MESFAVSDLPPMRAPHEVDGPWLTSVVRSAGFDGVVGEVRYSPVGTGQVADSYRFCIDYATGSGPTTMVGKFASLDENSAKLGGAGGLYEREIRFYRELAPRLTMTTARPYAAIRGEDHVFTLLLEDLAPARTADQLVGCSAEEARLALTQAAALHAGSWHDTDLANQPWLRSMIDGLSYMVDRLPRILERLEPTGVFPKDQLDAVRNLVRHQDAWRRVLGHRTALWHQDFRLDNLLFTGAGESQSVAVLDWQTVCYGPSIGDVSLLLGTGMSTEDRRRHEDALVSGYHRALLEAGVTGFEAEECWDGYRLMALHGVFAGIIGAGRVKRTERGDRMWQSWVERHLTQAEDLGSWNLLRRA